MPDIRELWESSLLAVALLWALVGLFLLTLTPIATGLWIAAGIVLVLAVYFGGDRLVRWGRGV